jgi:hypothetical protein
LVGVAIADKVRRIPGVPLPGEAVPGYGAGGEYVGGGDSPRRESGEPSTN